MIEISKNIIYQINEWLEIRFLIFYNYGKIIFTPEKFNRQKWTNCMRWASVFSQHFLHNWQDLTKFWEMRDFFHRWVKLAPSWESLKSSSGVDSWRRGGNLKYSQFKTRWEFSYKKHSPEINKEGTETVFSYWFFPNAEGFSLISANSW